jgi:O-antigen ligase
MIETRKATLSIRFSSLILILSAVFLVLKTYRGFSGSTTEGGIWNYIQLAFVLFGFFYFFRYSKWIINCKPILTLVFLSAYMLLTTLIAVRDISINSIYNLAMTLYALNVMILFYHYGRTTDISKRTILLPVFFIIALIVIYAIIQFLGSSRAWTQRGAVSDVYYVIGLLPLMLVYFAEKRVLIPIITASLAVAFSGKRAGMIAVVIMIIAYYLIIGRQKDNLKQQSKTLAKLILVIGIVIAGGIYLDNHLRLRIVERILRLSTDGGSGRDVRWELVWGAIKTSGPLQYLFGHGGGTIKASIGGHAHNDFLELFYEQGLIGAVLYAAFYIRLIILGVRMIRKKYQYAAQFTASLICSLVLSMFSFYIVDPTYITCGMICLGMILGDYEKKISGEYHGYSN